MRDVFVRTLESLAESDDRLVLLTGDLSVGPVLGPAALGEDHRLAHLEVERSPVAADVGPLREGVLHHVADHVDRQIGRAGHVERV